MTGRLVAWYDALVPTTLRPSLALFISEPARAIADYAATLATATVLLRAARGDGHPVLVLPGLLAEDVSTATMRLYLRSLGYEVHGWRLGRNLGPTPAILSGITKRLEHLHRATGRQISLVGWSLGGIFARELARATPPLVRQVITLGSPFRLAAPGDSRANTAFERLGVLHASPAAMPPRARLREPIPVPATAIYSRLDGVVPWQACTESPGQRRENVAIYGSHLGMGHNAAALWVIADRLAQPEGMWQRFRPPAAARYLFPERDEAPA